jgi:ABC-type sugar transport system permease subunit
LCRKPRGRALLNTFIFAIVILVVAVLVGIIIGRVLDLVVYRVFAFMSLVFVDILNLIVVINSDAIVIVVVGRRSSPATSLVERRERQKRGI